MAVFGQIDCWACCCCCCCWAAAAAAAATAVAADLRLFLASFFETGFTLGRSLMAVLWDTSDGPVNRVPLPDDAVFAAVVATAAAALEGTVVLEEAIVVVSCNCCC